MSYEPLAWDSEFFDVPIGRLTASGDAEALREATARADADGIHCLYNLVPAAELEVLHASLAVGFLPYDIRVEFERSLDSAPQIDAGMSIRKAGPEDEAALSALAAATIGNTRFALDDHFSSERVSALYPAWIRRGLHSGERRQVLAIGELAGFVVIALDRDTAVGHIELIAVSPEFTRRNLGRALMSAAHATMIGAGCQSARVVTQARNLPAQRLYEAVGYRTKSVAWWLHRWR